MNMIEELTDKNDPEFLEFWNSRHKLTPKEAGFDPSQPLHRIWAEWDAFGRIVSACMFVPMIQGGVLLGHHAYIASDHRSKCLIRFCRTSMEQIESDGNFGLISIETRQMPELKCIDKLARFLGFAPYQCPDQGWTDYLWNSKERKPCHQ